MPAKDLHLVVDAVFEPLQVSDTAGVVFGKDHFLPLAVPLLGIEAAAGQGDGLRPAVMDQAQGEAPLAAPLPGRGAQY